MPILINNKQNEYVVINTLGFSGGERHIQLDSTHEITEKTIKLKAHILSSDDVMDLLLVTNALRHKFGQELDIKVEMPYLPYARQDRVCAEGQAFSLELFSQLLKMQNLSELIVWDCHSPVGIELTDAINVEPADIIKANEKLVALLQNEHSVLVCPDKGAVKRCSKIKEQLELERMIRCEKKRDPMTGKIIKTEVLADDLTGLTAVITDDICDGGFTFTKIAEQLQEKNVARIVLFVTHGIFSKGIDVFDGLIDTIYTTNSFPHEENKKLKIIDFNYKL